MLTDESVVFTEFDEEFFRLSGVWLSDPEIRRLTDTSEFTENQRVEWFKKLPDRPHYRIFGVLFNGVAVGVCGLKNITPEVDGEYWGYIGDKMHWGQGIGSAMVEFIVQLAIEQSLERLYLKVIPQNTRAISLYSKQGFRVLSAGVNSESITMEKVLRRVHARPKS